MKNKFLALLTIFIAASLFISCASCGKGNGNGQDADQDADDATDGDIVQDDTPSDEITPAVLGKIRAAYTYRHSTEEAEIDLLMSHGINALIIKGGYDNNTDYSAEPDGLPESVRNYAALAKQKDLMFFQAMNFTHYHFAEGSSPSIVTDNHTVYYDGTSGGNVSPWDEVYWQHLIGMVVNLARLPADHPAESRIDGVWIDFELYNDGGDPIFFSETWGFEDPTFEKYLVDRDIGSGPVTGTDPPRGSDFDSRSRRYGWLEDNDLLEDYYLFLTTTIHQLALNMKNEVHAVNPDFLLGAYPSPTKKYIPAIYAGWSDRNSPMVVWATEMYNGGGASRIPDGLNDHLLPEGYYEMQEIYGDEIYGYYVGGIIAYEYPSINFAYHLYTIAHDCNGFWIWTTWSLTEDFSELPEGYQVECYNESEHTLRNCENADQYAEEAARYFAQMDEAAEELDNLEEDPSYESHLGKVDPGPTRYEYPDPAAPASDTLQPMQPQSGELTLDSPARFRRQHNFVIYAQASKNVEIEVSGTSIGTYEIQNGLAYIVIDSGSNEVSRGEVEPDTAALISFSAPGEGNYYLMINPGRNAFSLGSMNSPVMLYETGEIWTFRSPYSLAFWVGSGTTHFDIDFSGGGGREGLSAVIYRPITDGYEQAAYGSTTEYINSFSLGVDVSSGDVDKIWLLEIGEPEDNPSNPMLEDVHITFDSIITPYFGFTDDESYFMIPSG